MENNMSKKRLEAREAVIIEAKAYNKSWSANALRILVKRVDELEAIEEKETAATAEVPA